MRILIALTYYRPHYSGLTIHAEREARALAARGHKVTVLTSRYDRALPSREVKDGVTIVRPKVWFHISKGVIMPSMPLWAFKLVRQSDVIHLHAPQLDAALIAFISRILRKPIVLTYHCDLLLPTGFVHYLANQASHIANYISASLSQVIVHNTQDYAVHSPFLSRFLSKVKPILPPVELPPVTQADLEFFREKYHILPGQRVIGMAARLATEKGVEFLAQALPVVMEKHPQARVLFVGPYQNVVGEEAYAERLEPAIASLGEHWTFLGVLSPVEFAAFLHVCELTVLPSINSTESYGLVQVESMMCGTPVVASDLPGVRAPVTRTGMGKVVPVADRLALAQAIVDVLGRPQVYRGDPHTLIRLSAPEMVAAEYETAFELAISKIAKIPARVSQKNSKKT